MYLMPPKRRRFGLPFSCRGAWHPSYLLALTIVLLGCEGSPDADITGPSLAVGTATHLAFTVQPNATTATAAIFPAVKVTALNAANNTATDFKGKVTIVIGHNPTGGVL